MNAVFHIHHHGLWKKLKNVFPTTRELIGYGTAGMAMEIQRLLSKPHGDKKQLIIMGGHEDGILSFGKSPAEAGKIILDELNIFNPPS